MRVSLLVATAVSLGALVPIPAAAQVTTTDADTREVQAYRLTMPKLRQLNAFFADLQRQQDADPAAQQLLKKKKELAALYEKDELSEAEQARIEQLEMEIDAAEQAEEEGLEEEDQSLSAMAERMAADPRVVGALKRAGLAAREAVVLQLAFVQAAFAVALLDSGTIEEIPKEVNTDNVKFVQANKAEIATLTAIGDQERE